AFVFDHPKCVSLAEGLDRRNPAVLLRIGLDMVRLAEQVGSRAPPETFRQKLGSLARLAFSAGLQKRDFLRRHLGQRPELNAGFFLERARLVVVPIGLDQMVRRLRGGGICTPPGWQCARQMVDHMTAVLRHEGRLAQLEACLDSVEGFCMDSEESPPTAECAAGVTPWDASATVAEQLHAAAELGASTAAILLPD